MLSLFKIFRTRFPGFIIFELQVETVLIKSSSYNYPVDLEITNKYNKNNNGGLVQNKNVYTMRVFIQQFIFLHQNAQF